MNKTVKIVIALVIVAAIAFAILMMSNDSSSDKDVSTSNSTSNAASTSADQSAAASIITYDGKTFTETKDSVMSGQKIQVRNNSTADLNFDSDPHPVHTDDPELNAGAIAPGESKTFTVTKKGSWGYHNHLNPTQHGTITVQ